jgi:glycerol kinase
VSALGAAWLAGLAVGVWRDQAELSQLPRSVSRFEPAINTDRRELLYAGWRDAVNRTRSGRSHREHPS